MEEKAVTLQDLVGVHKLSGVDMTTRPGGGYSNDQAVNVLNFVLDGKTYSAVENPDDGYRSMMDAIYVSRTKLVNTFAPQKVFCHMDDRDHRDVLIARDFGTGKILLEVGTDSDDGYYPVFIANFFPENMAVNAA